MTKLQRALRRTSAITGGVRGATGGRADALKVDVPAGSYVVPADIVAALGEGNTEAGMKRLEDSFGKKTRGFRAGGTVETVPILISDGEYVIAPEAVARIGGPDALDRLVTATRQGFAEHLKRLPGPNGANPTVGYRGGGRIDGRLQRQLDRVRARLSDAERAGFDSGLEQHLYAASDRETGRISVDALNHAERELPVSARDVVRQMRRRYER